MCTVQRQDVKNIFNVGPRLLLFDGMDGIAPYINPAVYLIASDGRLLKRSLDGVVNLIEPDLLQGGSAKVYSRLIVFCNILMNMIQWFIVKSDKQVTVTDPDKAKNLVFDGSNASAVERSFSWKVWQASPGSDLFL